MEQRKVIRVTAQNGKEIRRLAQKKVERVSECSEVFNPFAESRFPRFNISEVHIGEILGLGGFCVVSEVRRFVADDNLQSWDRSQRCSLQEKERDHLCSNTLKRNGDARFALKQLSDETRLDANQYLKGVVDLATELKFLAVIDHPHIIKMRAVSDRNAFENIGFFIVLDRLYDTLERRCLVWRKKKNGINALMSKVGATKSRESLLLERLAVSHHLCGALTYLHGMRVIYRDLKPENIGFDMHDKVKIFDFGLAREVLPTDMLEDGTWKLTGLTGSLRYMAPEVVKWKPYNFSADVYSYGILLWQIFSLKIPFDGMSVKTHNELAVEKKVRPPIKSSWPDSWGALLQRCWHADLRRRASLENVATTIKNELMKVRSNIVETQSDPKRSVSEITQDSLISVDSIEAESFCVSRAADDTALDRTLRADLNEFK